MHQSVRAGKPRLDYLIHNGTSDASLVDKGRKGWMGVEQGEDRDYWNRIKKTRIKNNKTQGTKIKNENSKQHKSTEGMQGGLKKKIRGWSQNK